MLFLLDDDYDYGLAYSAFRLAFWERRLFGLQSHSYFLLFCCSLSYPHAFSYVYFTLTTRYR